MSTRSNIAIRVRPADYQRVSEKINATVSDETPYINIYSHHDGYPEHMMPELEENYNDYDSALELILQGCTSGIYEGNSLVYTGSGESYEDNAPWPSSRLEVNEEYLYVFEDDAWEVIDD